MIRGKAGREGFGVGVVNFRGERAAKGITEIWVWRSTQRLTP